MASVNKAIIVGNVGQDPEARYSADGAAIVNLSVATTYKAKDKEHTEWHRVAFFGKLAEIVANYVKKGSPIYVEGRLQTRKWTDKEGVERFTTEIIAEQMQMLGKKSDDDAPPAKPAKNAAPAKRAPQDDDSDLPF